MSKESFSAAKETGIDPVDKGPYHSGITLVQNIPHIWEPVWTGIIHEWKCSRCGIQLMKLYGSLPLDGCLGKSSRNSIRRS
jgi:hypothetical protein